MAKIEKLYKSPLKGSKKVEIYPITVTKAVYDENNETLDNILLTKQNTTSEDLQTESKSIVGAINELANRKVEAFKFIIVDVLPDIIDASTSTIYLILNDNSEEDNNYYEYIVIAEDDGTKRWELIGTANIDLSGYMKNDGSNYVADKKIVTPTISTTWTVKDWNDNITSISLSGNKPYIEYGYKVSCSATYKWIEDATLKSPTQVVTGSSWTDLPASNTPSSVITIQNATTPKTLRITLQAPKSGLMVDNGIIKPASGNQQSEAIAGIIFLHRNYFGKSTKDSLQTLDDLKSLGNSGLTDGRIKTILKAITQPDEYYFYVYPKVFGLLTNILVNDFPSLGGFNYTELTITNDAGLSVDYYVYRNNQIGAFTTSTKVQYQ